jgi:hypothetical protein
MRTDPVNTVRIFRTTPPSARWGQNTAYAVDEGPPDVLDEREITLIEVVVIDDGGTTADTALRYTPTVQRVSNLAFRYALLELGLDPEACGTRDGSMTH